MAHTPEHIIGETRTPSGAVVNANTGALVRTPAQEISLTGVGEPITGTTLAAPSNLTVATSEPLVTPDVENIPIAELEEQEAVEAPSQASDLERRLTDANARITGFDTKREEAADPALVSSQRKLLEINKRIQLQQVKAQRAEEEALRQGRTLGFARGEAAIVRREAAFKALELSALAQFAQGNVLLARDLARDAVAAKFEQETKDRDTARQNLIDNFDSFNEL